MTTVRLYASENSGGALWEKLGSKALWEEVAQSPLHQLGESTTEEAVSNPTTRGIKTATKIPQTFTVIKEAEAKLPEGCIVVGVSAHFFGKASQAANKLQMESTAMEGREALIDMVEAGATTEGWRKVVVSKAHLEATHEPYTRKAFIEGRVNFDWNNTKATEARWNVGYIEVEYELAGAPHAITASFNGSGLLVAKPNAPFNLKGVFVGLGTVLDKPNTPRQLAGAFPGVGALLAGVKTPRQVPSTFAGSGLFAAKANTPRQVPSVFAGVGSFAARVNAPQKLRAVFAGVGNLLATITAFKAVTGQRTPTRISLATGATRVAVTGAPTRTTLGGAAARVAVTNPPSRIALDPHTTKVVI